MSQHKSNFITSKKRMTMKKQLQSVATNLLSLAALCLLFSSFTIVSHEYVTTAVATKQSFWSSMQDFSFQKLGFWQKTALFMGASTVSAAVVHRHYRRHYSGGLGCLGVLGIIIIGALIIALLPVILVVGLVMLILGIPLPRFNGRGRRHYRRDWR
jgi:hypothetical protein